MQQQRITSIDSLRGLVIALMALDHVRDYFHNEAFTKDPLDVLHPDVAAFFTRWVTHFCAPVFIFLAGTSVFLSGQKKSAHQQQLFLLKRGLWLMLIELTVVNFGWTFNPYFQASILQVIWAIGACMVLLGLCIKLPYHIIVCIGVGITLFHNTLDYLPNDLQNTFIYHLAHTNGFHAFPVTSNYAVVTVYGILPWFGIMCLGYGIGKLYHSDFSAPARNSRLRLMGIGLILTFIVIRIVNVYGDPSPWNTTLTGIGKWLSFINVTKYPPSLAYTLLMIGLCLLLLSVFDTLQNTFSKVTKVFGSVPFFFYIIHIYLIHVLCIILFFVQGYSWTDRVQRPFWFRPDELGIPLTGVYAVWIGVLIMLYPICKWFSSYKAKHQKWWLKYL